MRILQYVPNSVVDGPGIRQVFYLAGCGHHCKNCHNPQSWDFSGGESWTVDEIVLKALNSPYNVTFSGGDPLYQLSDLKAVCAKLKPNKTIWVYTGFTYEEIRGSKLEEILPVIDILVDGRFEEANKNDKLLFRGSSNQRIIDVKRTLETGTMHLWKNGNYGEYL